ncbi:MAG: hypothetical protein HRF51_07570 [bacterium]
MRLSPEELSENAIVELFPQVKYLYLDAQFKELIDLCVGTLSAVELSLITRQWLYHIVAEALYGLDDFDNAEMYLTESQKINDNLNHRLGLARNYVIFGHLWNVYYGDFTRAISYYGDARAIYFGEGLQSEVERLDKLIGGLQEQDSQ